MPYFKGDFTADQLEIMRRAAAECAAILGVRGSIPDERKIAVAILTAAHAGCWRHGDLVALGLAAVRKDLVH